MSSRCFCRGLEKCPHGAVLSKMKKSPHGAKNSSNFGLGEKSSWCPCFSNYHHEDFSPNQNGKFVGHNVLLVLTFGFFEPHRGSRGLPLAFLDSCKYFDHFMISGVATSKPSVGLFFQSKEKKTLNAHISKSLLAPKVLFSKPLQS